MYFADMKSSESQAVLFEDQAPQLKPYGASTTTFLDNLRLPVHRWFRFSAGFSGAWVREVVKERKQNGPVRVFDPFAGSGTTLIAAQDEGAPSSGVEAHPFVYRVARAKLARGSATEAFAEVCDAVKASALRRKADVANYPKLIQSCFTPEALADLDRLRAAVEAVDDGSDASQLAWLALVAILRRCSHVGTAQWQYVLPRKSKRTTVPPMAAFAQQARMMLADMKAAGGLPGSRPLLVQGDARDCLGIPDGSANLVITSPPYPNNYDYADATRLEMSFLREVRGWGDLQQAVRRHLVRSCTQHVPERAVNLDTILDADTVKPIRDELANVSRKLAEVRLSRGGRKTYHLMVACYFHDLARVWMALRRVCASPSQVCFVIGDSAPYGVYVPAIEWLGRLALAAGFRSVRFERTRDRNTKWKNRKHRVPLCEGRLWVEG